MGFGSVNAPGKAYKDLEGRMASLSALNVGAAAMVRITIPKGRMRGDVDGDGKITQADVNLLNRYLVNAVDFDSIQEWCADAYGDGTVSVSNVSLLLRYIAGTIDALPNWADYYSNWTYGSGSWYTDIPVDGLTAAMSAVVVISGQWDAGTFTAAELRNGKVRLTAGRPPITDTEAMIVYGKGNGSAVLSWTAVPSPDSIGALAESARGAAGGVAALNDEGKVPAKQLPASMPASDVYTWAKQPNKPSYTCSEVGAASSGHTHTAAQMGAKASAWKPFHVGTSAPTDKTQLWIDTTVNTGGLKYWSGSAWVTVPVGYV